jgi:hypothetical protein
MTHQYRIRHRDGGITTADAEYAARMARTDARGYLAAMPQADRAALDAEWLAGEATGIDSEKHSRAHLASMTPERRTALDAEWK